MVCSVVEERVAHETVLLEEAVAALQVLPAGVYVDATFGRGGHSQKILSGLGDVGRLYAFDKDPEAISLGRRWAQSDERFEIVHRSFAEVSEFVQEAGLQRVDGILADLGVSSPQLDDASRGFSFLHDGPLDMRMNNQSGVSAEEWVNTADVSEIARVLKEYGEERFAKRIAKAIVERRAQEKIVTTKQLASTVAEANPAWEKHKHPATRTFQAIRIRINNELDDLETFLATAPYLLNANGRLVVISFHSLEDRLVKRSMRALVKGDEPPPGVPVLEKDIKRSFRLVTKALKPSEEEVARNARARSAVMRILEKVADDD